MNKLKESLLKFIRSDFIQILLLVVISIIAVQFFIEIQKSGTSGLDVFNKNEGFWSMVLSITSISIALITFSALKTSNKLVEEQIQKSADEYENTIKPKLVLVTYKREIISLNYLWFEMDTIISKIISLTEKIRDKNLFKNINENYFIAVINKGHRECENLSIRWEIDYPDEIEYKYFKNGVFENSNYINIGIVNNNDKYFKDYLFPGNRMNVPLPLYELIYISSLVDELSEFIRVLDSYDGQYSENMPVDTSKILDSIVLKLIIKYSSISKREYEVNYQFKIIYSLVERNIGSFKLELKSLNIDNKL